MIIKFKQLSKHNIIVVNKNDLKVYNFDFNQDLNNFYKITLYKIKKKDMGIFFANFSKLSFDFNSSLHLAFS